MIRRLMFAIIMIGTMAGGAYAQTSNPHVPSVASYLDADGGLTIDDAVAQALRQEPGLQSDRADIAVAQAQRMQAGLRANPMVSFAQQEQPGGTDSQTRLEVAWPLELGRRAARIQVADAAVRTSALTIAARERDLAGRVRQVYADALSALQELAVDERIIAVAVDQQRLVQARVDQGAAPDIDARVIDVDLLQLRAAQLAAAGRVERALVDLRRTMGMPPNALIRLRGALEDVVVAPFTPPAALATTRADVAAAEAQVTASDAEMARARAESKPEVSVAGMYMRMDAGFPQQAFSTAGSLEPIRGLFHYASASVTMSVPLFNRNQGALRAAEETKRKAALALTAARATADAEIEAARIRSEQARAALLLLERARATARQNVAVLQQSYQLGRATLVDVLDQQRRFAEVERQYGAALVEAFASVQEIRQASGGVQ
jgi:cobalt-zinc-cadmium efflux system outer membrane protein